MWNCGDHSGQGGCRVFPSSRKVVLDRPTLGGSVLLFFPIISMSRPHQVLLRLFIIVVRKVFRRREWLPTPVFLPGDSHGQRNLAGYSPWGCKETDTTERLTLSFPPPLGEHQRFPSKLTLPIIMGQIILKESWSTAAPQFWNVYNLLLDFQVKSRLFKPAPNVTHPPPPFLVCIYDFSCLQPFPVSPKLPLLFLSLWVTLHVHPAVRNVTFPLCPG